MAAHTGDVRALAISPNGRLAVSGSHDHTVRVWDLSTGKCMRVLLGHTDVVWAVAISPDGRMALSASPSVCGRLARD
ncbi:TPA: hypothetical protein N0F65_003411 [Lagenidium giganteum]|uniref:Uncharacterized protein n=1 Tax=Lagenidium giganteum TaxID=4803 RepID=A0AAV2YVW9_9STRA|nr:TPA: hypothetical protein N0F65_003411 [Lagenidium giganteum]